MKENSLKYEKMPSFTKPSVVWHTMNGGMNRACNCYAIPAATPFGISK